MYQAGAHLHKGLHPESQDRVRAEAVQQGADELRECAGSGPQTPGGGGGTQGVHALHEQRS